MNGVPVGTIPMFGRTPRPRALRGRRAPMLIVVLLLAAFAMLAPAAAQTADLDTVRSDLIGQLEKLKPLLEKADVPRGEREAHDRTVNDLIGEIQKSIEKLKLAMKGRKDPKYDPAAAEQIFETIHLKGIDEAIKLAKAIPPVRKQIVRGLDQPVVGRVKKTRNTKNTPATGEAPWSLGDSVVAKFKRAKTGRDNDGNFIRVAKRFLQSNTSWGRTGLEGYRHNDPVYLSRLFRQPFTEHFGADSISRDHEKLLQNIARNVAKAPNPKLRALFTSLRQVSLPTGWSFFLDGVEKVSLGELEAAYGRVQKKLRTHLLTLKTPWTFAEDTPYDAKLKRLVHELVVIEMKMVWILGYPRTKKGIDQLRDAQPTLEKLAVDKFAGAEPLLKSLTRKWADYRLLEGLLDMYGTISLGEGTAGTKEGIAKKIKEKREVFDKEMVKWNAYRKKHFGATEDLFLDRIERGLKAALEAGKTFRPHVRQGTMTATIYELAVYGDTGRYVKAGFFKNLDHPSVQAELLLNATEKANFELHSKKRPRKIIK